jgi:hypothetical protein
MQRLLPAVVASLTAVAIVGISSSTAAGVRYVDRWSRGGPCDDGRSASAASSPSTPWCSLRRAVEAAPSGSSVIVRGGSYSLLEVRGSNSRSSTVTFTPASGESVTVDGLKVVDSSYLRFERFTFDGPVDVRDGAHHVQLVSNHLPGERLWLYHTDRVLVEGNHIHDIPASASAKIGIRLIGDTNAVVRGNRIENLVEDPIQTTSTTNMLIEGNELRNAHPANGEHTDAIHTLGADGLIIRGNYIRDIEHGLMFTDKQAKNVTIENNVLSQVNGQAMKAEGAYGMPNLKVVNNTMVDAGGAVDFRVTHPGALVRNNIFHKVAALGNQPTVEHNLITGGTSGGDYGSRSQTGPAGFVNAAGGDYGLTAGSQAVDSGSGAGTTTDRTGQTRVDDPNVANRGTGTPQYVDLGAQERGGGTSPAPTPERQPARAPSPVPAPAPQPQPAPGTTPSPKPAPASTDVLRVSTSSTRSNSKLLHGARVARTIYVFVPKGSGITGVRFFIDEVPDGTPFMVEANAPWDFAGTRSTGAAVGWYSRRRKNGTRTITAVIKTASGTRTTKSTFTIAN